MFGAVPAAPTCTGTDQLSGPAGCPVTGYSTAVGTHTLTATATDLAGNTARASSTNWQTPKKPAPAPSPPSPCRHHAQRQLTAQVARPACHGQRPAPRSFDPGGALSAVQSEHPPGPAGGPANASNSSETVLPPLTVFHTPPRSTGAVNPALVQGVTAYPGSKDLGAGRCPWQAGRAT